MKKTTERKLAELIARRESIKTKSAMRRIQRAAKAEKPLPGATRRQKQLLAEYVAERKYKASRRKAARVEPDDVSFPDNIPVRTATFDYPGTRLLKLYGRVELGSSGSGDIRDRYVNAPVDAETANAILNAGDKAEAIRIFQKNGAQYLGEVHRFDRFEFGGEIFDSGDFE